MQHIDACTSHQQTCRHLVVQGGTAIFQNGAVFVFVPFSVVASTINIPVVVGEIAGAIGYNISYEGPTGGEITAVSGTTTLEHNITGLVPDTQYTIRLYADTGSGYVLTEEVVATTLGNTAANYDKQDYAENGIFNLRPLMQASLGAIQSVLDGVFDTGDVLGVSIPGKPIDASFINIADNLSIRDVDAVIIPFATTNGSGQDVNVTLSDESTIVTIAFDDTVNTITIDNVTYGPGDSLILDGKKVTVVDT